MAPLLWLALGAFAIGTETFMVAGILPSLARDFQTTIGAAAYLMTAYALSYAVTSPILSSLLANASRKPLLITALSGFGVMSLAAAFTQSLALMMLAQVALAIAAGLFMPTANAVAVMLAPPERRGRALAIVTGGLTLSTALGVPLGIAVAALGDWRFTFVLCAVLSFVGVAGLAFGLPSQLPRGATSLRDRLLVAARPPVLRALSTTFLWITGNLTLYACIAPFLATHAGVSGAMLSVALVAFGVGAAIGNAAGGRFSDRFGPMPTLRVALLGVGTLLASFSIFALVAGPGPVATGVALIMLAVLGAFGWAGHPAQSTRLVGLAPDAAVVALSLNASSLYLGIAAGAALSSLVATYGALWQLGFVGAACQALALLTTLSAAPAPRPAPAE